MIPKFYNSDLLISIINRHCNNTEDLDKIINACELLRETAYETESLKVPSMSVHQLLAKAKVEKSINTGIII